MEAISIINISLLILSVVLVLINCYYAWLYNKQSNYFANIAVSYIGQSDKCIKLYMDLFNVVKRFIEEFNGMYDVQLKMNIQGDNIIIIAEEDGKETVICGMDFKDTDEVPGQTCENDNQSTN